MKNLPAHAVFADKHGGPEVLSYRSTSVPPPAPGELRIVQKAIGLNYADVYQRQGSHGPNRTQTFPVILGSQGSGIVESIGDGVQGFEVGQEVAYIHPGAYASARLVPADRVLPLPVGFTFDIAAATLLRGMTAEYLLLRLYKVQPGDRVLIHAAAGGMGQILAAWSRSLGAIVIGTVGSSAKIEVALAAGCHHVVNYRLEAFPDRVNELTNGEGVAVVYDAVGKDVFLPSLQCLRVRGMAINYGTASGDVEAFDLQILHAKSHSVCRPTLRNFIATPQEFSASAKAFAAAVAHGDVAAKVDRRYSLEEASQAHIDLESRVTTGAAILIPEH